jgi:hypothetical protein
MRRHGNGSVSGYGDPNGTAPCARMLRNVDSTRRLTSTSDATAIAPAAPPRSPRASPERGFARTK